MQAIRAVLASGMLALTALLAACGGGGDAAAPDAAPGPTGTATVGTSGGTLTSDDGVRLTLPPGSLSETITLRVARDTTGLNAALLASASAPEPDKAVSLSPTYAMTPHGTTFARPVELRIPIDAAAAKSAGPGMLVALRTEPGRDGWDVLPIRGIENGQAVVSISSFSFYKIVKITGLPMENTVPVPPNIEMSLTLDGAPPAAFIPVNSQGFPYTAREEPYRRLFGRITNQTDSVRLSGRVIGLPAACSRIALSGNVAPTQDPTAVNASGGSVYAGGFMEVTATVGSNTVGRTVRTTLDFSFDLNMANAPYKAQLYQSLRAANNTGPTPPIALSFNAFATCPTPVMLGGGIVLQNWHVMPGVTQTIWEGQSWLEPHGWMWATILYTPDYLPHGWIGHPQDVTVPAGMPASFTTSAWPVPIGEQRIEWWRSNDDGAAWSRVRTAIVPVSATTDTFTLPATTLGDNNAIFRVRLCAVPRTPTPAEACTDGVPAKLTVVDGVSAAGFSQQPRPVLVRTGQTATFSVAVSGTPAPSVRWQRRAANSSGAWADVSSGSGAATLNYTTTPLTAPDNGVQLRAVANNLLGDVASVPVTVSVSDIDVPPTVASQPGALNVVAGSEAVFAVVARGTEALSYQWRRNGMAINGANAPVLKLAQVTPADATGYSVLVSNSAGIVVSDVAELKVSDGLAQPVAPSIVTQPVAVVVNAGNTATFAVGVSGSGPMSYQWLRNGAPIAGATSAFHSIAQAAPGDAGAYSVQVSSGASTVTSAAATMTVSAGGTGSAPAISTQPATLVVAPGSSATLAVAASGSGPLAYQWLHDGVVVAGQTSALYHFAAVSALDVGAYQVRVSNGLGEVTSAAAQLLLVGAPALTAQPANISVVAGSNASFSVGASGDALRYQWLRDSVAISGATGASYTTATVLGDNGARFSVLVYNSAGLLFSQAATLTVTAPTSIAEWQTPKAIETDDTGDARGPSISVNAAGEAMAVWMQPGGGVGINIWANRFTPAGGWGIAERISKGQGGAQGAQVVAIDVSGHAIAVWQEADHIWANRYTPGNGWNEPTRIDVGFGSAGNPQIGVDAGGNALVVWWQSAGGRINVESVRYAVGSGWGNPATLDTDNTGDVSAPQVAVNAAGNAVVAWAWAADTGGGNYVYNVWATRYLPGIGWGNAEPLDTNNAQQPNLSPHAAVGANQNAIVVWHRRDNGIDHVKSSHYSAGGGWVQSLEVDPAVVSRNARVAIDAAGNALAVWEQYVGATANVMASRYNGGTWAAPTLIETDNTGSAHTPQIVIDANGIGTAFWSQRNSAGFTDNVWVNRYTPSGGWGSAVTIDGQTQPATQPALGVDANGALVVVWEQMVGALSNLWASGYR